MTARYELTLFVSGASDLSSRAVANARQLCDVHLEGRYDLSVVDVHENPAAARNSQVLAAPTLIKSLPLPVRTLVGDLSDTPKVLAALELPVAPDNPRWPE
jgi:circadian clock protein KaiB